MSFSLAVCLSALAGLIIVGLSVYAWRLWHEVRRREAFRADEIARANRNCVESLDAISKAMVERQVDLIEGALRCKVLLDILDNRLVERDAWRVFADVQEQAAHLQTHGARRALSPRQRHREDLAREAIARQHEARLDAAAIELQRFCREWSL